MQFEKLLSVEIKAEKLKRSWILGIIKFQTSKHLITKNIFKLYFAVHTDGKMI